jgi:hypothetical protein
VVAVLRLCRRDVSNRFQQASVVEPIYSDEGSQFDIGDAWLTAPVDASALESPLIVSAIALSYESPTLPTEGSMPGDINQPVTYCSRCDGNTTLLT